MQKIHDSYVLDAYNYVCTYVYTYAGGKIYQITFYQTTSASEGYVCISACIILYVLLCM